MSDIDPREFMDTFAYVQRTFVNIAELLKASQPLLAEHGFQPYGDQWKATAKLEGTHFKLANVASWLPHYVVRQYCRPANADRELLTVGALPWDRAGTATQPWMIASFARIRTTEADSLYYLPFCQVRSDFPPDGIARWLGVADVNGYDDDRRREFARVIDGDLLTIGVPMLDIRSVKELGDRLVEPLCAVLAEKRAA